MRDGSRRTRRGDPGEGVSKPQPAGGLLDRRMLITRGAATLGAFGVAGIAAACGSSSSAGGGSGGGGSKQMAFAQPDTAFAGYPLLLKGVKDYASSRGFSV